MLRSMQERDETLVESIVVSGGFTGMNLYRRNWQNMCWRMRALWSPPAIFGRIIFENGDGAINNRQMQVQSTGNNIQDHVHVQVAVAVALNVVHQQHCGENGCN